MTNSLSRRSLLGATALGFLGARALATSVEARAAEAESVTIGWPQDVPSWDPNQRFVQDAQPRPRPLG